MLIKKREHGVDKKVLYEAMSDGTRRLTMKDFFHYNRPDEIAQSKGMYSFVPESPLLRLMCEIPDFNRN